MADTEIPADLIQLKRDFFERETRLAELAERMPPSTAVAVGEAAVSDTDRAEWNTPWREQGEIVLAIHRHPALEGLSQQDRYAMQEAAAKAARATR